MKLKKNRTEEGDGIDRKEIKAQAVIEHQGTVDIQINEVMMADTLIKEDEKSDQHRTYQIQIERC